jgi:hypothetical protein
VEDWNVDNRVLRELCQLQALAMIEVGQDKERLTSRVSSQQVGR